jgi:hypothetical protein
MIDVLRKLLSVKLYQVGVYERGHDLYVCHNYLIHHKQAAHQQGVCIIIIKE